LTIDIPDHGTVALGEPVEVVGGFVLEHSSAGAQPRGEHPAAAWMFRPSARSTTSSWRIETPSRRPHRAGQAFRHRRWMPGSRRLACRICAAGNAYPLAGHRLDEAPSQTVPC
jgi:hypothetical protein